MESGITAILPDEIDAPAEAQPSALEGQSPGTLR
jgi:hypothetical protein